MPHERLIEIIELSATVANGATDTRASREIPFPFEIHEIEIHSTGTLQTNFILRYGVSGNEALALANDPTFRDLRSERSSNENRRYPDSVVRLQPHKIIREPNQRLKAEAINASGVVHDYMIIFIIEAIGEYYG